MPRVLLINPSSRGSLYAAFGWQPLSLACVAAATPPNWEVEILDEVVEPLTDDRLAADVVGITAFTAQAPRAYQIAARAKAAGAKTILGGVHATFMSGEALEHVDAVVTGEAERVWPSVLEDVQRGCLERTYTGGQVPTGRGWPCPPRRDLFRQGCYTCASTQTSRGCPVHCSFCSVTAFNGRTYRSTGPGWMAEEFRRIPERRVFVVDDNFIGSTPASRDRALQTLENLSQSGPKKDWLTQVTIDFGDDDTLPRAAAEAGCVMVFVGFESLDPADLATVCKKRNVRLLDRIARIRGAGISVIGSFMLGIDGQDIVRTVDSTLDFVSRVSIDAFNPTLFTPLPGTRAFERFRDEDRFLFHNFPADWEQYSMARPTVRLLQCSAAKLYCEYLRWMDFFEPSALLARAERTRQALGEAQAEAAYLWNRPWAVCYRRAAHLPPELPPAGKQAEKEPPDPCRASA